MRTFLSSHLTQIIVVLGTAVSAIILSAIWFGYFYHPHKQETTCDEIPIGSVVLVAGFQYHLGTDGKLNPAAGNKYLAQKLVDCAGRLSVVITQQAIIEALSSQGVLSSEKLNNTVPIYLMHQHCPDMPVRTLQSLKCAINRLAPLPDELLILAHDKHLRRAVQDLRAVYSGKIIEWRVDNVPYADEKRLTPFLWAIRELFLARPAEAFLRWAGKRSHLSPLTASSVALLGGLDCPIKVKIKQKINLSTSGEYK